MRDFDKYPYIKNENNYVYVTDIQAISAIGLFH